MKATKNLVAAQLCVRFGVAGVFALVLSQGTAAGDARSLISTPLHISAALTRGATSATSPPEVNVGQTFQTPIVASCYDSNGVELADTVTLTVSGAPSTGGAHASFDPNPVATFTQSILSIATGTSTDAGTYSIVVGGTGPVCGDYGTYTVPLAVRPILSLARNNLRTVSATGQPANGGRFSYDQKTVAGTSVGTIGFADGYSETSNPNRATLVSPPNPSGIGAPSPGGLASYTVNYRVAGLRATNDTSNPFRVPVFGMSCYFTTLESDWGSPPTACKSVRINGVTYSGTVTNPPGLHGTYCSAFIAEVKLQGSGVLNSGQYVQYNPSHGTYGVVAQINGADGTPVVAGRTIARDRSIVSGRGILVDIAGIGNGLLANDTGGAIIGYRFDLYNGSGKTVCHGYNNPMDLAACNPAQAKCPASVLQ